MKLTLNNHLTIVFLDLIHVQVFLISLNFVIYLWYLRFLLWLYFLTFRCFFCVVFYRLSFFFMSFSFDYGVSFFFAWWFVTVLLNFIAYLSEYFKKYKMQMSPKTEVWSIDIKRTSMANTSATFNNNNDKKARSAWRIENNTNWTVHFFSRYVSANYGSIIDLVCTIKLDNRRSGYTAAPTHKKKPTTKL